jgi:hypothetical protein
VGTRPEPGRAAAAGTKIDGEQVTAGAETEPEPLMNEAWISIREFLICGFTIGVAGLTFDSL